MFLEIKAEIHYKIFKILITKHKHSSKHKFYHI
jgi:hypothetical protein